MRHELKRYIRIQNIWIRSSKHHLNNVAGCPQHYQSAKSAKSVQIQNVFVLLQSYKMWN